MSAFESQPGNAIQGEFAFPEALRQRINVDAESGPVAPRLRTIAQEEGAALLAFIGSHRGIRISPTQEAGAFIGPLEEFAIEYALSGILEATEPPKKVYLLMHTPGGSPSSCYKIARVLRTTFETIRVFIPYASLSGGTLIALAGDEVVMGLMGQLSPIDTQLPYREYYVSAYSLLKALSRISEYFSTVSRDEAPYPWQAMADKLDPVLVEEWSTALEETAGYCRELLQLASYSPEQIETIINSLVYTDNTHGYVVHPDKAREVGIRVSHNPGDKRILDAMREWLASYMFSPGAVHCIRYVVPEEVIGGQD